MSTFMSRLREFPLFLVLVVGSITLKLWYVLISLVVIANIYAYFEVQASALYATFTTLKWWGAFTVTVAFLIAVLPKKAVDYLATINDKNIDK